jgi:hypothetical protein
MSYAKSKLSRRSVLRGIVGASAVSVGLPFLECFLNSNGTALASGAALPVRFGTWFWGLGMDSEAFIPKKVGPDYDLPPEIESWKDIKQHVNLLTNYHVITDGKPNVCHFTGWVALRTGSVPITRGYYPGASIDVTIGDVIGGASRFRSLDCTATGNDRDSYSFRSADAINAPVTSPIDLYQKLFGAEFQDPNSPNFTPNPNIILRRSVLSGVRDESASLEKHLGTADRARLDQYFTSIRELEERLALQLQKPAPAPSCKVPSPINGKELNGLDALVVAERHRLMADLMAMGVACNQTKVFNMVYSISGASTVRKGLEKTHHTITHEEFVDDKLGYQPTNFWFLQRAFESYAYFIKAFASIPEGDGTLLDNCLIYAHSDQEFAKIHSITGVPMMTAGKAGGRMKTGIHVDGKGEPGTRLGYTLLQVMGVNGGEWGTGSMKTSRAISEILV